MRILLKFVIDCDADAAWRALHSPRAVSELYGPLLQMNPLNPDGLPTSFAPGDDVPVELSFAGVVPMGRQLIHVSDRVTEDANGKVRIFRDSGMPLTGPLSSLDVWDHQMAISPAPGDPTKTLWRDRLVIGGPTALAMWPVMWTMWQWRAARVKALAPTWAHDPEMATADRDAAAANADTEAFDRTAEVPDTDAAAPHADASDTDENTDADAGTDDTDIETSDIHPDAADPEAHRDISDADA